VIRIYWQHVGLIDIGRRIAIKTALSGLRNWRFIFKGFRKQFIEAILRAIYASRICVPDLTCFRVRNSPEETGACHGLNASQGNINSRLTPVVLNFSMQWSGKRDSWSLFGNVERFNGAWYEQFTQETLKVTMANGCLINARITVKLSTPAFRN